MAEQVQLATRIDARLKAAIEVYCEATGMKISKFVESAILDKLEEIEDIADLRNLRTETTRPFKDVVKELKLDGLL